MKKPIPFGKYLLLERVNVGGMAEVFKAKASQRDLIDFDICERSHIGVIFYRSEIENRNIGHRESPFIFLEPCGSPP